MAYIKDEIGGVRLWAVAKPIRKVLGLTGKSPCIRIGERQLDSLAERFPSTYLSILAKYRAVLRNQTHYRICSGVIRIVAVGLADNAVTQLEFTCERCGDGLVAINVSEGSSTVGKWRSVKTDSRKISSAPNHLSE